MLVFAHRGASGEFPENTLLAFEKAIEQDADGIEFDVQQAKDELVIVHDRMINLNGNTYWLEDHSLAQLQQLTLPHNQTIPTLSQTLSTINGQCLCNIELKKLSELSEVKLAVEQAIQSGAFTPEQIIISAFDHHLLPIVQNWQLGVEVAAIIASNPIDYGQFALDMGVQAVHADLQTVSRELVDDLHQKGLPIRVYTVDHERDIHTLLAWGVDAIFSNFPERAKQTIQAHTTQP